MSRRLRVLTMNLWGLHGDWTARRAVLKQGFREVRADLLVFQESITTRDYDQVKDLLPDEYEIVHQTGRSPDGTGNSIASRFPVGDVRERFLHVTPRVDPTHGWIGSVAAVELRSEDHVEDVLLVHFKPSWEPDYERERELQATAASRFVEEILNGRNVHVLVAGDFDASPESPSVRFWKEHETGDGKSIRYLDAWDTAHPAEEGDTFTPQNPLVAAGGWSEELGRRIDYIFVRHRHDSQPPEVVNCSRLFDRPIEGVWASDHFGILADLELPGVHDRRKRRSPGSTSSFSSRLP